MVESTLSLSPAASDSKRITKGDAELSPLADGILERLWFSSFIFIVKDEDNLKGDPIKEKFLLKPECGDTDKRCPFCTSAL